MNRSVSQVGRRRPLRLAVVTASAVIAVGVAAISTHAAGRGAAVSAPSQEQARMQPPGQTSSRVDGRPVRGEWRSHEQFDGQPRAAMVVLEEGGELIGSLTLLGMTRGADDRATVRLPFRGAAWDGTTLSFDIVLPDNEGKTRWALRIGPTGKGTLRPTTEEGQPVEAGPMWEMSRR